MFLFDEEDKKKRRHSPEQNVVKKRKGDKDLNRKWFNAIFSGSLEKTIRFIENGVDVNSVVGLHNRTALHAASLLGYVDIVKVLIRSGAGVNAVDKDGQTPLHLSITKGHVHQNALGGPFVVIFSNSTLEHHVHLLDPKIRLSLRIDHQGPSSSLCVQNTVLNGEVIQRKTVESPLSNDHCGKFAHSFHTSCSEHSTSSRTKPS